MGDYLRRFFERGGTTALTHPGRPKAELQTARPRGGLDHKHIYGWAQIAHSIFEKSLPEAIYPAKSAAVYFRFATMLSCSSVKTYPVLFASSCFFPFQFASWRCSQAWPVLIAPPTPDALRRRMFSGGKRLTKGVENSARL
jgi:hypothetical protein